MVGAVVSAEVFSGATSPLTVRQHARNHGALDGADAQALEHALTMTERERDNLLARIHRDGGHHTDAVGLVQSLADADKKVAMMNSENDQLKAEVARLKIKLAEALDNRGDCGPYGD